MRSEDLELVDSWLKRAQNKLNEAEEHLSVNGGVEFPFIRDML